jgi:hypothetical protein
VGTTGRVYAADINPKMIEELFAADLAYLQDFRNLACG